MARAASSTRRPPEILTEAECQALIDACSRRAPTGIRNAALIAASVEVRTADRGGARAPTCRMWDLHTRSLRVCMARRTPPDGRCTGLGCGRCSIGGLNTRAALQINGRRNCFVSRRRPFQLALLFGQFGLDRGLLLPQSRDFADHRVDRGVLFGDRFRQRALVGVDVVELALGRLELFLRGLRRRARLGQRQGADRRQQQPREEQRAPLGRARMVSRKKARIEIRAVPGRFGSGSRRLAKTLKTVRSC